MERARATAEMGGRGSQPAARREAWRQDKTRVNRVGHEGARGWCEVSGTDRVTGWRQQ